jgi:hypothetical protein
MLESLAAAYFKAWVPGSPIAAVSKCLESYAESSSATLSDCLTSAYIDAAYPGLSEDLYYVLEMVGDDVISVLRLFYDRGEQEKNVGPRQYARFPSHLFALPRNSVERPLGFDVADCHLHSGASLHVQPLLRALAGSLRAPTFAPKKGRLPRVTGQNVVPTKGLLLACRWAIRYMWEIAEGTADDDLEALDRTGLNPDDCSAVLCGEFWVGFTQFEDWSRRRTGLKSGLVQRGACPPFAALFWDYLLADPLTEAQRRSRQAFAIGLSWAVWRLSMEVASRYGEGLTRFVDRFTDMGVIRDSSIRSIRRQQIFESLKSVAPSRDVVGAEFRKSITARTRQSAKTEIRASLRDHLQGFAEYLRFSGRSMSLCMPVTFVRRLGLELGELNSVEELRHSVECASALSECVELSPDLTSVVHAVDVVGSEIDSQNWPFLVAFEMLAARCPAIVRCIHAGEAFSHELTGIRKIGELLSNSASRPHRIGHALALDVRAAKIIASGTVRPIRLVDAVLDLTWAAQCGVVPLGAALSLVQSITSVASDLATISADDWYQGASLLGTLAGCERASILLQDGLYWRVPTGEEITGLRTNLRQSNLAGHLLAHGLQSSAPERSRVSVSDMADYMAFSEQYVGPLREYVTAGVRDSAIVESCPTSNLVLGGIGSYEEHPLWSFAELGFKVTVSSDDPVIFGSSIVDEFERLAPYDRAAQLREIAARGVALCGGGSRHSLEHYQHVVRQI